MDDPRMSLVRFRPPAAAHDAKEAWKLGIPLGQAMDYGSKAEEKEPQTTGTQQDD